MNDNIIYGKKVILFALELVDLPHFIKLHREDKKGNLQEMCLREMSEEEAERYIRALLLTGQIKVWSVYTKDMKNPHRIGFIYLHNMTSFSTGMAGEMDSEIVKGLGKIIRNGKYTYSEDTSRTLIDFCFNRLNLHRVETSILESNHRSLLLTKKVGWREEGKARDAIKIGENEYKNLILLSILNKDWKNGKSERSIN